MATVKEYLQYAEECVALAMKSGSSGDRAHLLQMAQAWRDLANKRGDERADPVGETKRTK